MDTLRFGTVELLGSAHQTMVRNGQRQVPALELRLAGPADQAALTAMQENALEILDENGAVQGTHTGYTVLAKHSVVLAQEDPDGQALAQANARYAALEAENAALKNDMEAAYVKGVDSIDAV